MDIKFIKAHPEQKNVHIRPLAIVLLFLLSVSASPFIAAETVIYVWTYYDAPPFNIEKSETNLTRVFCDELTANSQGKWRFIPSYIPRPRLLPFLEDKNKKAIVAWVNPIWFDDKNLSKYLWTKEIFINRNEVISNSANPIEYDGPESLVGKKLGGVLGHSYADIDNYVEKGLIQREDTHSFANNVHKLLMKHASVDAAIVPDTQLNLLLADEAVRRQIHISKNPHQVFTRRLMLTPGLSDVRDYIDSQLPIQKPEWEELIESYGVNKAPL
jgi:polar amino acid transport system substrate-binding protein